MFKASLRLLPDWRAAPAPRPETQPAPVRRRTAMLAEHGMVLLVAVIVTFWIFRPWRIDLKVPLAYGHDSIAVLMWTKSVIDEGWWLNNTRVGAPDGLEMHDYPTSSNFHFLILKGMVLFSGDAPTLVTLYYFLGFPLAAWTAYIFMRQARLSHWNSLACAVLFAAAPYHLWRGVMHLFLSAYFLIPLFFLTLLWLARDPGYLFTRDGESGRIRFQWNAGRTWATIAILAAVASDFPYVPIFALMLLVPAALYACTLRGRAEVVRSAAFIGVLLAGGFVLNMLPTFVYHYRNGPNPSIDHAATRPWTDGEEYGFKLIQMFLPTAQHPLQAMRDLNAEYYAKTRTVSEADSIALGAAGSIGLLALLVHLCMPRRDGSPFRLPHFLAVLTVVALLVGMVGGFGTILNFLSIRSARCYCRLSIFVGFLSLVSLAFLMQYLLDRARGAVSKALAVAFCGIVMLAGLHDQIGRHRKRDWQANKTVYANDRQFVKDIEAVMPEQAMIFQFPQVGWLSYHAADHAMEPYDHFRGYLHSSKLRWSYGCMHGRATEDRQRQVADLPPERCLEMLATWGFDGIYIDRNGYSDKAAAFESKLAAVLNAAPMTAGNGRLSFFSLLEYKQSLAETAPLERREAELQAIFAKPFVRWGAGAGPEEALGDGRTFRWCAPAGHFGFSKDLPAASRLRVSFESRSYHPGPFTLKLIQGETVHEVELRGTLKPHAFTLEASPGPVRIEWKSNAAPGVTPDRTVHIMLVDLRCEVLE